MPDDAFAGLRTIDSGKIRTITLVRIANVE